MKYLTIIMLSLLTMASCNMKSQESVSADKVEKAEEVEDTLIFKSTANVDSVDFLILRSNPSTTLITMADSVIPDISDSSIALCVEAAFTGELLPEFKSTNVAGDYVIDGIFHKGYKCKANTGFLCTFNGHPFISSSEHVKEWIDKSVASRATLFQQILIVQNGKDVYRGTPIKPATKNIYRAACIMTDGNFSVIQSEKALSLKDFIDSLIRLGVSDALYLDVGTGWNYGWYRETSESPVVKLFDVRTPYQTNWLIIRKRQLDSK